MQTLKSLYRIVVMGTTLAIIVMGWQLYGPTAAQSKTIALRGIEWIQSALRPTDTKDGRAPDTATANLQPTAFGIAPASATQVSAPPPLFVAEPNVFPPQTEIGAVDVASGSEMPTAGQAVTGNELWNMQPTLSKLTELNVMEPTIVPWGRHGELYRCSCRAALGNSPQFSRHFESVAAEPAKAIEQVVAQVSLWRQGDPAAR